MPRTEGTSFKEKVAFEQNLKVRTIVMPVSSRRRERQYRRPQSFWHAQETSRRPVYLKQKK